MQLKNKYTWWGYLVVKICLAKFIFENQIKNFKKMFQMIFLCDSLFPTLIVRFPIWLNVRSMWNRQLKTRTPKVDTANRSTFQTLFQILKLKNRRSSSHQLSKTAQLVEDILFGLSEELIRTSKKILHD